MLFCHYCTAVCNITCMLAYCYTSLKIQYKIMQPLQEELLYLIKVLQRDETSFQFLKKNLGSLWKNFKLKTLHLKFCCTQKLVFSVLLKNLNEKITYLFFFQEESLKNLNGSVNFQIALFWKIYLDLRITQAKELNTVQR